MQKIKSLALSSNELDRGANLPPPPPKIGSTNTPPKIGLKVSILVKSVPKIGRQVGRPL